MNSAEAYLSEFRSSRPSAPTFDPGQEAQDFDRFALIAQGHVAFQLASAGVEVGLFQTLSERPGLGLEQLAEVLGLDGQPTRILVEGPQKNTQLFSKIRAELPAGGGSLVFGMMGNDDGDGPVSTALGSPYFLTIATGEGMLYGWKDYEQWLQTAGFAQFERREGLPCDHGLIIATR